MRSFWLHFEGVFRGVFAALLLGGRLRFGGHLGVHFGSILKVFFEMLFGALILLGYDHLVIPFGSIL